MGSLAGLISGVLTLREDEPASLVSVGFCDSHAVIKRRLMKESNLTLFIDIYRKSSEKEIYSRRSPADTSVWGGTTASPSAIVSEDPTPEL